jgi:hypothetical protein
MLAQSRKPKLSSQAQKFLTEIAKNEWAGIGAVLGGIEHVSGEVMLFQTYPGRQLLLGDVANLRDEGAVQWFWRRWLGKIRPEWDTDLIAIRNELRSVWQKPDWIGSEQVLDKWLGWLPSSQHLQIYKHFQMPANSRFQAASFRCSIKAGKLVPDLMSLRAMLIQGVFEHWQHFKFCSNPVCAAPYFIAKRRDQTVCDSGDCKAAKQRQHALKWWTENRAKK